MLVRLPNSRSCAFMLDGTAVPVQRRLVTRVSRDALTRVTRKGMSSPSPGAAHVLECTSVQLAVHKQRDLNLPGQPYWRVAGLAGRPVASEHVVRFHKVR